MPFTRREMLKAGLATAALSQFPLVTFGVSETEKVGTPVPFLDELPASPNRPMIRWDQLTEWITPDADFFFRPAFRRRQSRSVHVKGSVLNGA